MRKSFFIIYSVIVTWLLLISIGYANPKEIDENLRLGSNGDMVLQLQAKLKEFGYFEENANGKFDNSTWIAVISFQIDSGLDPDGIVGPKTRQALREYKSTPVSRGQYDGRKGRQIITIAKQYLGVPYVWGGTSPRGFDCSGYIYYLYKQFGIDLPRMADGQFAAGVQVKLNDLQPGDLVFFTTYEPGPSHCGIYLGNGYFIHASSGAGEVTITPLFKPYYKERYLGARRVIR